MNGRQSEENGQGLAWAPKRQALQGVEKEIIATGSGREERRVGNVIEMRTIQNNLQPAGVR